MTTSEAIQETYGYLNNGGLCCEAEKVWVNNSTYLNGSIPGAQSKGCPTSWLQRREKVLTIPWQGLPLCDPQASTGASLC
jgi:hypothetical protein